MRTSSCNIACDPSFYFFFKHAKWQLVVDGRRDGKRHVVLFSASMLWAKATEPSTHKPIAAFCEKSAWSQIFSINNTSGIPTFIFTNARASRFVIRTSMLVLPTLLSLGISAKTVFLFLFIYMSQWFLAGRTDEWVGVAISDFSSVPYCLLFICMRCNLCSSAEVKTSAYRRHVWLQLRKHKHQVNWTRTDWWFNKRIPWGIRLSTS